MLIGILSDTHDRLARTQAAIRLLSEAGAEALVHCGDLTSPPIVEALAVLPSWFVLGNQDADNVPALQRAAAEFGPVCLGWGEVIELAGRRIGVTHGHMTTDMKRITQAQPDYLLSGHSHLANDTVVDGIRRLNPGALHRADRYTVGVLDLVSGNFHLLRVDA